MKLSLSLRNKKTSIINYRNKIKAKNPVQYRWVKVETIGDSSSDEITRIMFENSTEGLVPTWEEIPDEDTVELDTETVFQTVKFRQGSHLADKPLHQSTIPLPMDRFGRVLSRMTAQQAGDFCIRICTREDWKPIYSNFRIVLNNLEMEMSGDLRD